MGYGQRYDVFMEVDVDGEVVSSFIEGIDGTELEALRYEAANRGPQMITFDVFRKEST